RTARRRRCIMADDQALRTPREAAARLHISAKTLRKHVAAGLLRYVSVGTGQLKVRRMYTDADLDEFIVAQHRRESPACRSTRTSARRIGNSISDGEVIAFTGQPMPQPGAKR